MTTLQLLGLALYVAAGVVAVVLARRDRRHRPVAWYLVTIVAIDLLQLGRAALLPEATGPREGWQLLLRHAECGLYLASILALPAMAWGLFMKGRPVSMLVPGLFIWGWLIGGYPDLRGEALMRLYDFIELGSVVASAGFFITWLRSERPAEERRSTPVMSGLALLAGTMAVTAMPALGHGSVLESWPIVVAANAAVVAMVLAFEVRTIIGAVR